VPGRTFLTIAAIADQSSSAAIRSSRSLRPKPAGNNASAKLFCSDIQRSLAGS